MRPSAQTVLWASSLVKDHHALPVQLEQQVQHQKLVLVLHVLMDNHQVLGLLNASTVPLENLQHQEACAHHVLQISTIQLKVLPLAAHAHLDHRQMLLEERQRATSAMQDSVHPVMDVLVVCQGNIQLLQELTAV